MPPSSCAGRMGREHPDALSLNYLIERVFCGNFSIMKKSGADGTRLHLRAYTPVPR